MTDLERRLAELERQMKCLVQYFSQGAGYGPAALSHDLTHPPAPEPPKIEVVPLRGMWAVRCGDHYWHDNRWEKSPTLIYYEFTAHAIAEKLTREGNYPPGVKA